MIGARELAQLPSGALVVNIGRGGLVDEDALVDALLCGHVAGAALDVTEIEPLPLDSPLLDAPNVILTPHVAWVSDVALEDLKRLTAEAALRLLGTPEPVARDGRRGALHPRPRRPRLRGAARPAPRSRREARRRALGGARARRRRPRAGGAGPRRPPLRRRRVGREPDLLAPPARLPRRRRDARRAARRRPARRAGRAPRALRARERARRARPDQLPADQPGRPARDGRRARREPRARRAQPRPRHVLVAAPARERRRRALRGRRRRGGHARRRRPAHRAVRADPVRAADAGGARGAAADRPADGQQVLPRRPRAGAQHGRVPRAPGPAGVHAVVAQSRGRAPRLGARHLRRRRARGDRGGARDHRRRARAPRRQLLGRRAREHARRARGSARAAGRDRLDHDRRVRARLPPRGHRERVHGARDRQAGGRRRRSARLPRRRRAADVLRLAAAERPDLGLRRQQLPARPHAAGVRHPVLERRHDADGRAPAARPRGHGGLERARRAGRDGPARYAGRPRAA